MNTVSGISSVLHSINLERNLYLLAEADVKDGSLLVEEGAAHACEHLVQPHSLSNGHRHNNI